MSLSALTKDQLITYLSAGCKPSDQWRIGTEHEKFLFRKQTKDRFSYSGSKGIEAILVALQEYGWQPIYENHQLIALKMPHQQRSISLEPGGQFELSGAPLRTLHETKKELDDHFTQMHHCMTLFDGMMIPMGFDPFNSSENMPWMPKDRYCLMRAYMPTKGSMGLDMMSRTCTVQVNLDFSSEADMVAKMRIGMALQPLATALFACSPFSEGKLNGYQSYRAHVWQNTDPDRSGILPFVFENSMGFERYTDYLLQIPMYFIHDNDQYLDARGLSFPDFIKGQLSPFPHRHATLEDWADQTTIAFPEVRLKQFLEMRGADSGPPEMMLALPAFWVGLLYDSTAQDEALQLIGEWSVDQIFTLHAQVPRQGLQTKINNQPLQKVAQDVLKISDQGLRRRAKKNQIQDESIYLDPLRDIAETGRTIAGKMISIFHETGNLEKAIAPYIIQQSPFS